MSRMRPYVGMRAGTRTAFQSDVTPTEETHPEYGAVIGPFRTVRGARFMASHLYVTSIDDAEIAGHTDWCERRTCIGCRRTHVVPPFQGSDYCDRCITSDKQGSS